jgi:hypothetical protein
MLLISLPQIGIPSPLQMVSLVVPPPLLSLPPLKLISFCSSTNLEKRNLQYSTLPSCKALCPLDLQTSSTLPNHHSPKNIISHLFFLFRNPKVHPHNLPFSSLLSQAIAKFFSLYLFLL